uniref:linear amide C-N hydrolase n=1 Tax=uncultured Dysgonomonas sp. TaxID=206096 RepID=UPI002613FF6F|nr:linear amide C-N hydrolase [uncultured Dysgonomonas sp.]
MKKALYLLVMTSLISFFSVKTEACTRVVYQGPNNTILTARSMDWKEDIMSNMWVFPKGMDRNGEVGPNSLKWKSKYGSVITSAYDISSTDGMNEKGLVANLLWLAESEYTVWDQKKPGLTIAAWVQYVLDNFATVSEAVDALAKEDFIVISDNMPNQDRMATLHLSISDVTGDNAIFEYIKGKLVIHHDRSYQVMTNSPIFEQQLALNKYWENIGGTTMLPGTNRAADRFVRASYYINAVPQVDDTRISVASVFSVIRNVSVPYGISTPNEPNISSTRWRTVSDQKNMVYYFESTLYPNIFWVDFKDIDFSQNAPVLKLDLVGGKTYEGNTAKDFKPAKPFVFQGI